MEEKIDWLIGQDEQIMTADDFDFAIIGICERAAQPTIATYDTDKCLNRVIRMIRISPTNQLNSV